MYLLNLGPAHKPEDANVTYKLREKVGGFSKEAQTSA